MTEDDQSQNQSELYCDVYRGRSLQIIVVWEVSNRGQVGIGSSPHFFSAVSSRGVIDYGRGSCVL